MNGRFRLVVAGVALTFVLAVAFGTTGIFTPKNTRVALGASTTLSIISGEVQVRHGAAGSFVTAEDGAILGPGDTVRTGADARAVLTYFEGSTVEIEPGSELSIQKATANPDGSSIIVMQQDLGTTWHVVTKLVNGNSKYEVHTTAATASVRGTAFTVAVDADGSTTETTTEGVVANTDAQNAATVVADPGLQVSTKKGERPAPPVPAPEPERKVTVTVGDQNSLVVDPLGRANGIKDGKRIVQTPGAQVTVVNGQVVVTLPNIPDGTVATHVAGGSSVEAEVRTIVEERGTGAVEVSERVKAGASAAVELKKRAGGPSDVQKKSDTRDLPSPKIGQVPPRPSESPEPGENAGDRNGTEGSRSTPPGQLLTPPGQLRTTPADPSAPGRQRTPPGQSFTPPGQLRTAEGQRTSEGQRTAEGQRTPEPARTPEGQRTLPPLPSVGGFAPDPSNLIAVPPRQGQGTSGGGNSGSAGGGQNNGQGSNGQNGGPNAPARTVRP